jgi:hypothetical protein
MQLHHAAYAASCKHTPMTHAYTGVSCSIAARPGHGLNSLTLTTATRAAGPRPNVISPVNTCATDLFLTITAGVHEWSCAKVKVSSSDNDPADYVDVRLHDGFNIVLGVTGTKRYLFLLNVARYHQPPLTGRAISVLCILAPCSMSMSKEMKCELRYSSYVRRYSKEELVTEHHQKSCFPVACTDLSGGGLPVTTDGCFQFVVPDCVVADNEKDTITVTAQFAIIDRPHFLFGLALNYKWFISVFSFCGHCV